MTTPKEKRFDWPLCYEAEEQILARLASFTERNPLAKHLESRLRAETGTLLLDWVDHLVLPTQELPQLRATGYVADRRTEAPPGFAVWWHPEAMLPRVLSASPGDSPRVLALRCESVADFLAAHGITQQSSAPPLPRYRQVTLAEEPRLEVVERRGYAGFVPDHTRDASEKAQQAMELWRARPRQFVDAAEGYHQAQELLDRVVAIAGRDLACHAVFAVEREYWQSRNRAAQVQKQRQDRLGLGWANHDHHTFRSSRRHFVDLMQALEKLGFERRERYYAGAQAGWGAQILEQPTEGLVAFCDVDLTPEETEIDFSRHVLPPANQLGTIGLWVGLHGESFLDAGLHHLECRFDYEVLREQLAGAGVNTMKPFSDLSFLKQAFTEGERWPVRPARADRLLEQGFIDQKQHHTFLTDGAIGSHLENLQRKGGFKGFNQKSVSVIIQATDPRLQAAQ